MGSGGTEIAKRKPRDRKSIDKRRARGGEKERNGKDRKEERERVIVKYREMKSRRKQYRNRA